MTGWYIIFTQMEQFWQQKHRREVKISNTIQNKGLSTRK